MSAGCLVGCSSSGDDNSSFDAGNDGSKGDATFDGPTADAGPGNDSSADSSTGDAAGDASDAGSKDASEGGPKPEAGPTEAGPTDAAPTDAADAGPVEAGPTEAGPTEAGPDDGGPTEAGPDDGGPAEAGPDDGGPTEAGSDGGGTTEAGPSDAGTDGGSSFSSPVQITGFSFNAHTVVTTATGGVAPTAMDGSGNNNDFPTQSEATALRTGSPGLPDNALFVGDGVAIPQVQLGWNNTVNANDSILVSGTAATSFSATIPSGQYQQLQIYATGGNGGSTLNYTLTYDTGSPTTGTVAIPDWCFPGTLASGTYTLASVYRVNPFNTPATLDTRFTCSAYAINLNPDPTRTLTQLAFYDSGSGNSYLVFYGATAW
jgi:hypothetical protein